jgi:hypothetical protein
VFPKNLSTRSGYTKRLAKSGRQSKLQSQLLSKNKN